MLPRLALATCLLLPGLASPALAEDPVSLHITFDAKAAAKIAAAREMVEVSVWYEGEPTAAGKAHASEIGLVYMGAEVYQIFPRDQTIRLGGARAGLPVDLAGAPMVTVNVYTARHVLEDNLLDCTLVSGPLAELAGKTHEIACKLIGG